MEKNSLSSNKKVTYYGKKTTKITTLLCQVTDLGVWKLAMNKTYRVPDLTEGTLYWC